MIINIKRSSISTIIISGKNHIIFKRNRIMFFKNNSPIYNPSDIYFHIGNRKIKLKLFQKGNQDENT